MWATNKKIDTRIFPIVHTRVALLSLMVFVVLSSTHTFHSRSSNESNQSNGMWTKDFNYFIVTWRYSLCSCSVIFLLIKMLYFETCLWIYFHSFSLWNVWASKKIIHKILQFQLNFEKLGQRHDLSNNLKIDPFIWNTLFIFTIKFITFNGQCVPVTTIAIKIRATIATNIH